MKEIKVYTRALYIVFLFVKREYHKLITDKNKTQSLCLHNPVKTSAKLVRIIEQVKTLNWISGFQWSALKFSQMLPDYEKHGTERNTTEKMFYFFKNNELESPLPIPHKCLFVSSTECAHSIWTFSKILTKINGERTCILKQDKKPMSIWNTWARHIKNKAMVTLTSICN